MSKIKSKRKVSGEVDGKGNKMGRTAEGTSFPYNTTGPLILERDARSHADSLEKQVSDSKWAG